MTMIQLLRDHGFKDPVVPERMVWTASALRTFRSCPRKFYWKYIMRIRPRKRSAGLVIGSHFHHALAEWYTKRRSSMAKISAKHVRAAQQEFAEGMAWFDQSDYDKGMQQVNMLQGMLLAYGDAYHDDRTEWHLDPKLVECKFAVDLGDYDYAGEIDIAHDGFIVEHKTTGMLDERYVARLSLDTQVRGYILGATVGLGLDVHHVTYNVVAKCKLRMKKTENGRQFDERVLEEYRSNPAKYLFRDDLMFNKGDVEAMVDEMDATHAAFEAMATRYDDPTDPRAWGINDHACTQYFSLCSYHANCSVGLDRMSANAFEQAEVMHTELNDA